MLHAQSLQGCFVSILQQPVHLHLVLLMLQAATQNSGENNLACTVIKLALTHMDNALAQLLCSFFQVGNLTRQLLLGIRQRINLALRPGIHTIELRKLGFHSIISVLCFLDFRIKQRDFFILLINLTLSLRQLCSSHSLLLIEKLKLLLQLIHTEESDTRTLGRSDHNADCQYGDNRTAEHCQQNRSMLRTQTEDRHSLLTNFTAHFIGKKGNKTANYGHNNY